MQGHYAPANLRPALIYLGQLTSYSRSVVNLFCLCLFVCLFVCFYTVS